VDHGTSERRDREGEVMRIAPELRAMVGDRPCECGACSRCDAQKELKALLRVAREARKKQPDCRPGCVNTMCKALAALDRASGGES
jgi:hypothetical protein